MKQIVALLTILFALLVPGKAESYKRIVSLTPSFTKMLYLLNAQEQLVGCTSYCMNDPKKPKEIVGSAIDVNIERLYLLKPDLVLVSELLAPATVETLKKLKLNVKQFKTPQSFDAICSQLTILAQFTGKEEVANKVILEQKERLNKAVNLNPKTKGYKMFFQIGAKPIFTVIPNTFMHDYITMLGCQNISDDIKGGSITRENVLVKNPDIIVVITMGIAGEEEIAVWKKYTELNAAKKGNIFMVDADKACSPTPIDFVDTLVEIAKKIKP